MPKLDKKFLEILKKKLSFGSTRSILINCIPGKLASRMSVSDLDVIKQGLSNEFIKKENLIFIICRREKQWTQILDQAGNKNTKFRLNSVRRAYITPGNLSRSSGAYEKIIERLKA
ncbi:hypothetical protein EBR37_04300 [bacterium]|nr:hypothetical protein [bacterium]